MSHIFSPPVKGLLIAVVMYSTKHHIYIYVLILSVILSFGLDILNSQFTKLSKS